MVRRKLPLSTLILVAITVAAIAGNILYDVDMFQPFEYRIYDWMSRLRRHKAADQVIVLAIDDQSIRQLGSWPWPRSYIADMVRRISDSGAHTLGLALLYPSRELNPGLQEIENIREALSDRQSKPDRKLLGKIETALEQAEERLNHDEQLISAIRSARNVVLPLRFTLGEAEPDPSERLSGWLQMNSIALSADPDGRDQPPAAERGFRGIMNNRRIAAGRMTEPYDELSTKAGAMGYANLISDEDGVVRKLPLLIDYQGRNFVSFAMQVARKYSGGRLSDIKVEPTRLTLKHLQIPTETGNRMLIDYGGQDANIRQISFTDVVNGKINPDEFRRKVVLLGVTAEGVAQHYNTPVQSNVPALLIEANAVENIINGQFISRPAWVFFLEILALLYFSFFLLFVIPKVAPRIAMLILGIFLLTWVGAGIILFVTSGTWLKILAPIFLSIIGFILTSGHRNFAAKQDENAELNKSLGLALQGQGMLDMAFEKFLKCPIEDQAVQNLLYNLGLDFERKRMTNKALSVYRHILKAGAFKDVKERIKKLISLENTLSMSVVSAKKETSLLVQNGATKPTLGRYEILQELGQGAMGTVYLGRDPNINREVAIKTVNYAEIAPDELSDVKARFFREAEAAGKLSHPNIVTIYDMGEDHDMAYMAMELLKGKELTHYCQKANLLPLKRVLKIIGAVAEALGYAHSQQVVHRDIKPANIILMDDDLVKVADFGIARVISSSKTQTGVIFGTPNYMSPEQIAGKKVDGRSDLFSLGVVFYEMVSGEKPFKGDSITALLYAVSNNDYIPLSETATKAPADCVEIVNRLLSKGVSKRYQTASQVIKDVEMCLQALS